RHTPPGGRVQMTLRRLDDGGVEVRVRDTGPGISEADLPHVFDRFYRAAPPGQAASAPAGGTGLGLAIVRSIMRLHGGSASAESREGHGATIVLRFPAAGS
ncbi:MAG: ATP-binding protein, partial [Bacteroidetes bacterium]